MSLEITGKIDNRSFCQSCGGFLPAGSICPDCKTEVFTMKKPNTVLPNCASKILNGGKLIAQFDPDRFGEKMARDCCTCGKCWECTFQESIDGPCPNCGATGILGLTEEISSDGVSAISQLLEIIDRNDQEILNNINQNK